MDFERLIEIERQNDDLLRQAREEAVRLRRAAREEADRRRGEADAELEAAVAAARAAMAERRGLALAGIDAGAREAAARFDAVTDAQVDEVAVTLLADLAHGGAAR